MSVTEVGVRGTGDASAAPRLTIVIVNWNGGQHLLRCLDSIRSSRTSFGVDVIVVDNHSSDGSREAAAAFPEFCVFDSGQNLGFGRANNLCRGMVQSPLVLFLNPDAVLLEDTLERVVDCLESRSGVGAVGCKMVSPDGTIQELALQWQLTPLTVLAEMLLPLYHLPRALDRRLPRTDPRRSGYVRKLCGGFLLARRDALEAAGWFDARYFMYAEDADLSRTMLALGWKLYYCSEATVIHAMGGSTEAAPSEFSTLMKQESVNKLMRKYYGRSGAILHRAATLVGGSVRLVLTLLAQVVSRWMRGTHATVSAARARHRQRSLVLWSLGLRTASVPTSPGPTRQASHTEPRPRQLWS